MCWGRSKLHPSNDANRLNPDVELDICTVLYRSETNLLAQLAPQKCCRRRILTHKVPFEIREKHETFKRACNARPWARTTGHRQKLRPKRDELGTGTCESTKAFNTQKMFALCRKPQTRRNYNSAWLASANRVTRTEHRR